MHNSFDLGSMILDDDYQSLLLDYASGALGGGLSLMMAAYVAVCPEARGKVAQFEALGGALMEKCCDPVGMSDQSLGRVLERLGKDETCCATQNCKSCDDLPNPIQRHLEAFGMVQPRWRKVWFGMSVVDMFPQLCAAKMTVMRLAPGASPPAHRHEATEVTLILDGALSDGTASYKSGDLFVCDAGTIHKPKACPAQGCTCMVMTTAPVSPIHPMARMLHFLIT